MGSRNLNLLIHWGGQIITGDKGLTYDGGHKTGIRLKEETSYEQFLSELYSVTGIDRMSSTLKITCRTPIHIGPNGVDYEGIGINDGRDFAFIVGVCLDISWATIVHVYLEVVGLNSGVSPRIENFPLTDPCRSSPMTQGTPQCNDPFEGRPESPLNVASSSQPIQRQELNEDNQFFPPIPETSMAFTKRGVQAGKRIEHVTNFEYQTGDDMDSDKGNDHISDDDSDNYEGEEATGSRRINDRTPPIYTQFDFRKENEAGSSQAQALVGNYLQKGLIFKTKKDLKYAVKKFSIQNSKEYIVDRSKLDVWTVKCILHDKGCKWRLRGFLKKKHGEFEITKYEGPHTCTSPELRLDHKHLDSTFIATWMVPMVKVDPSLKVFDIIKDIKREYGYKISYSKAWQAKQKAIARGFGDWKGSYATLPSYFAALQVSNPGTIHELSTKDGDGNYRVFDKNFWAFSASIAGFVHCRPVISIDATHLLGKYKGKLFIAMGIDANGSIFPLAFGFAEDESVDSWWYFLTRVWRFVVRGREGICLLSDYHSSILSVINSGTPDFEPPRTYHRYCLRHVCSNFCKKFKAEKNLENLFWAAATANQQRKFTFYMEEIKKFNEIKADQNGNTPWKYLNDIPLEKWTLLYDGGRRYGETTTNVSKLFNGVLLGARNLPIISCVKLIFLRLVEYFCEHRENGLQHIADPETRHVPEIVNKLEKLKNKARGHEVVKHDMSEKEAAIKTGKGNDHTVNLRARTCTCGKWFIYKYPCSHVLAAYAHFNVDPSNSIDPYYSLQSYVYTWAPKLHPVLHEGHWPQDTAPVLIPDSRLLREKGRPSRRIHNEIDISDRQQSTHCGICGQQGHSRRTCDRKTMQQ